VVEQWAVETDVGGLEIIGIKEEAEQIYEMKKRAARRYVEFNGAFSNGLKERVRLIRLEIHVEKELKPEVDEDGEGTGFWEETEQ